MQIHSSPAVASPFDTLVLELRDLLARDAQVTLERVAAATVSAVEVDEEQFHLTQLPDTDAFTIYCELDHANAADDPAMLRGLLELNLALATTGRGGIAIDGDSERILLAVPARHPTTASDVLRSLGRIATQVSQWRQSGFRPGRVTAAGEHVSLHGFVRP